MRYVLLISYDEDAAVAAAEQARRAAAFTSAVDQLAECGVLVDSQQLQPAASASTVRCWDGGDVVITGGPAVPAREQLAGWLIAECKDKDEAIGLATRIPAAWYGTVEVRPGPES